MLPATKALAPRRPDSSPRYISAAESATDSASASVASSHRRTRVSSNILEKLFKAKQISETSAAPPGPRTKPTHSVASQSSVSQDAFALCTLVLDHSPHSTITREHAEVKQRLVNFHEGWLVDVLAEEQRYRIGIFIEHRDGLDLYWRWFTQGPRGPVIASGPSFVVGDHGRVELPSRRGSLAPSVMSPGERKLSSPSSTPRRRSLAGSEIMAEPRPAVDHHRLIERVKFLEKMALQQQAQKGAGSTLAVAASSRVRVGPRLTPEEMEAQRKGQRQALADAEKRARAGIVEHEADAWDAVRYRVRELELKIDIRQAQRSTVVTPFTSYRPRVPIEAGNGEEFLRRWLLAETFRHYDDLLVMVQRWENDNRNAIEDERDAAVRGMMASVVLPQYAAELASANTETTMLRKKAAEYENNIVGVVAAAKLETLIRDEEHTREVLTTVEDEAYRALRLVEGQLESVRRVYGKIGGLDRELQKQRWRHKREVAAIKTQLPRDGVHSSVVPYTLETASLVLGAHDENDPNKPPPQANRSIDPPPPRRPQTGSRAPPRDVSYWAGFTTSSGGPQ